MLVHLLKKTSEQVMKEGLLQKTVTVVADGATTAFVQISGTAPNVIVTDLDGIISDIIYAQKSRGYRGYSRTWGQH